MNGDHAHGDQRQAGRGQALAGRARTRLGHGGQRRQRAQQQLPGPGRQQEEACGGRREHRRHARRQAQGQDRPQPEQPAPAALAMDQEEHDRGEDVELLLHRQRPGVQQRLGVGGGGEIARGLPEIEIGDEGAGRDQALAEIDQVVRQQDHQAGDRGHQGHGGIGREDAADALEIEVGDAELAFGDIGQDAAGDDVAGDDEEDVDPGEAAGQAAQAEVVSQHRQDGHGAQAVDIPASPAQDPAARVRHPHPPTAKPLSGRLTL